MNFSPQFVFDKKIRKIYRIKIGHPQKADDLALIHNQIYICQMNLTQNHNYAVKYLHPSILKTYYSQLPPELKSIADTIKEDDNPVLMLIKFKG